MRLRKGHNFSSRVLHRGEIFFLQNLVMSYIKKRRILCRLQKYELILVTNAPKKSYWRRKILKKLLFGALLGENIRKKTKKRN
jgi:hypothetical protein